MSLNPDALAVHSFETLANVQGVDAESGRKALIWTIRENTRSCTWILGVEEQA